MASVESETVRTELLRNLIPAVLTFKRVIKDVDVLTVSDIM